MKYATSKGSAGVGVGWGGVGQQGQGDKGDKEGGKGEEDENVTDPKKEMENHK